MVIMFQPKAMSNNPSRIDLGRAWFNSPRWQCFNHWAVLKYVRVILWRVMRCFKLAVILELDWLSWDMWCSFCQSEVDNVQTYTFIYKQRKKCVRVLVPTTCTTIIQGADRNAELPRSWFTPGLEPEVLPLCFHLEN